MSEHKFDLDSDAEQNYSLNSTGCGAGLEPRSVQELTAHIQCVLQNVQDRFQAMSQQVGGQMEEMGARVDDLEKTIADVMTQAGMELTL